MVASTPSSSAENPRASSSKAWRKFPPYHGQILSLYILSPYNCPSVRMSWVDARRGHTSSLWAVDFLPSVTIAISSSFLTGPWSPVIIVDSFKRSLISNDRSAESHECFLVADGQFVTSSERFIHSPLPVSGQWEFQADDLEHFSVPRQRGYIPFGFNARFGEGPRVVNLRSEIDLIEGTTTELRQLREDTEGESTGSCSSSSSDYSSSWGLSSSEEEEETGVEDGKKAAEPILVPSSNSDATNDLGLLEVPPTTEHIFKHSFDQGGSLNYNSEEEEVEMAPRARTLGKPRKEEKGNPLMGPLIKKGEGVVAVRLALLIFGLQYVANLAAEDLEEFGGKLIMMGAQAVLVQRNQAEQRVAELKKKQLAEFCPGIFQDRWLACLKELGVASDHPAWAALPPLIQLPNPPATYPLTILPGFNKEEYAMASSSSSL
ncbi:hypothetical protein Acr_00g0076360 [Actinidia rufa]|uniref:Uncharacterized protein n=1 Tax=Actinidia rufa TaxID=165716 RepID=A0A7J0DTA7_9ERIC|nr:hypothetical protein Acr_00g0076360 [Actinidia rufa]